MRIKLVCSLVDAEIIYKKQEVEKAGKVEKRVVEKARGGGDPVSGPPSP